MIKSLLKKYADQIGITGSIICLIHCLAVPVLALIGSGLSAGGSHYHWFEGDEYFFVAISFSAVYFASRNTQSNLIKIVLWFFSVLFALSISLSHHSHEYNWLIYLSHFSTVCLIIAHFINIKSIRKQASCVRTS
ncbi:MAG: MerC domain-containing protein [Flammeovirgaceae bacterium]|nr:MerC domain-containing protein [Flammeovirgaceae bacterium]